MDGQFEMETDMASMLQQNLAAPAAKDATATAVVVRYYFTHGAHAFVSVVDQKFQIPCRASGCNTIVVSPDVE